MHRRACLLVALSAIAGATTVTTRQASSAAPLVPPSKARRISAIWGHSLTFLPTWAPSGVEPSHWWSETCACGTDDSLLVVQFSRQKTRLDWEVSDQQEIDRVRAGVVCHRAKFAARVINSRAIFFRRATDTAWMCIQIPAGARWYPSEGKPIIAPLGKLIVSVRQRAGRTGRLKAAELERMVASAQRSSLLGRTSLSRFELPSHGEIRRMVLAFQRPLFLPTRLPGGFIYSDWSVAARIDNVDPRRQLSVRFARDSLFQQVAWHVSYGADRLGLDCPSKHRPRPEAVINGRPLYANEGIHGVSVWTCFAPETVDNAEPLEVSMWYDIRLHNPKMLRLAMRMVGTAKPLRVT
jgi:hypothetical protein